MIIDLYLIVVLSAVGFQTSVKSFSIVPSIPSSTIKVITPPSTTRLYATTGQTTINRSNSKPSDDFWGSPRSSEEIEHFVSDAIFDKNMRGGEQEKNNYDSSQVVNEKQWVEVISAEPPLLIVHGFLEHLYCDQIVDATLLGGGGSSNSDPNPAIATTKSNPKHQLKRSTLGSEQEESNHRTSSTAWLHEECCEMPLRTFATRSAALSCLPPRNMENLQVVRYEPGEEFRLHTDHLDSFNEFDCGGRLCTLLVYLNDSSEPSENIEILSSPAIVEVVDDEDVTAPKTIPTFTGGQTNFPEFHTSITPTKGSALFFFNVLERPGSINYNVNMFLNVDTKLRHAGLPVLTGEKWIANRWIHPRNFGAGVRGLG